MWGKGIKPKSQRLTRRAMTLFIFAAAATRTRIVTTQLGFVTPERRLRFMMVMTTVRAVYVRLGFFGLRNGRGGGSES